jgi:uncharacterized protein YdhG (YjbR/CyaY superfamily)
MRKQESAKHSPAAKKKGTAKAVDEYFARVPDPARGILARMRAAIRSVIPREATEVISYGIPAFRHNGIVVWYAAFAKHCSLFPTKAVVEAFKSELRGYTLSKGTVQFALDQRLPGALVKKLVRARVEQMKQKP